ncbi:MAG: methyltransferase [Bacteroidetes bacterium 43-16]|uniref:DNA adenine methylase n=1 Tax=uncultured Dysgonomonas sp. TaxID=206096 RepID=UPI000927503B|nr:DNA adenine methylase [uncultured Dysgonomonas sp.]OJV52292.1 MAG: methyltransferase [Bacteroidetes bacterium 43-16]
MENNKRLRPPLTYYGGKQTLAPIIEQLIPPHDLYGEPFFGGGAVFFLKHPSKVEVINDANDELMNFYRVAKTRFKELNEMIQLSLISRDLHHKATVVYHNPSLFDEVRRAWAIWVLCMMGFSSKMDGPFGFDKKDSSQSKRLIFKKQAFTEELMYRLEKVQIESADALYVIQSRDHDTAFFYCDPPYVGSNMGHYKGYTDQDFRSLLQMLASVKGKFLLSSYPSPMLTEFIQANGWNSMKKEITVTVNIKGGNPKTKTEVLTANYPLDLAKGFIKE